MDKNAIKRYAVRARSELIDRVSQKALQYGITAKDNADPNADSVNGRLLTDTEKKQRRALITKIKEHGYEHIIEEAAYTWFNRFAALRFMEANGYLPSHVRVFTNDEGEFRPQILSEAIHLDMDGLNMDKVYELKNANKDEELFKYLLITQCNAISPILPKMFQRIEDYTELLLPDYLLREGSVIHQMIEMISEEDWTDEVQIIGWLYQYYNTEPKDKVFADLKKNIKITKENIPAATQLFTPDWIVRYMVENSLGRLWLDHSPSGMACGNAEDALRELWMYYIDEAEQEPEVEQKLKEIRQNYQLNDPNQIKFIDPCCGSGHILVYAFDVLVQIYISVGVSERDAVQSILQNNLFGLDIDDRAVQLAYFAVMMKARQYDRRFFSHPVQPQIYSPKGYPEGEEFGSLLTVEELEPMPQETDQLRFDEDYEEQLNRWDFRRLLVQKYDVVCTNPPYMGASNMNGKLGEFLKKNYPDEKSDMFACFINRGLHLIRSNGFNCMVTMQSWMFLSSFEKMREKIIANNTITNLMHMENMVMGIAFGTAVSIFRGTHIKNYKGTYNHIQMKDIQDDRPIEFPVSGNRFSQVSADNFSKIPGSPVAYWVSEAILFAYLNGHILGDDAAVKIGMGTGKNEVFVKEWWEVCHNLIDFSLQSITDLASSEGRYFPYNKWGEFRLWFGNLQEVLWFDNVGRDLMNTMSGHRENGAYDWYCKQGLTWSFISSSKFGVRFLPNGCFFDVAGSTIFSNVDNLYILGFLSSKVCFEILSVLNPTLNYQAGNIKNLPIIYNQTKIGIVDGIVERNIDFSKTDWDSFETSWDFQIHPLIRCKSFSPEKVKKDADYHIVDMNYIKEAYTNWSNECYLRFQQLKSNEEELNRIFIDIYNLQDELTPEVEDKDVTVRKADLQRDIKSLISYAVGCMFGRYSLDVEGLAYAGGEWDSSKYTTFIPDKDAILPICDDEYFDDDIMGLFVKFIETVYGKDTLEENLQFIADALSEKGKGTSREIIRNYFINGFYADHCKIYQKRPIYWLFDSGKQNGFKAIIYMHRYQPDTLARIRTDYVHEQQSRYRTAIADLEQRINGASTSERVKLNKRLSALQAQAAEIGEYEEKIHHLADQMIHIDLDDGVKHNYEIFKDVLAKIK